MITLTLTEFLIYMGWACLGQVFAISIEQLRRSDTIKKEGFSIKYWICDNGWRVVGTVIAMIVGVVFTEPILRVEINELTAFFAGMGTDKIIDAIDKYKKK